MRKLFVTLIIALSCSNAFAVDLMPDLDSVTSNKFSRNTNVNQAIQNGAKAFFIQTGFKSSYNSMRKNVNSEGDVGITHTANFIDNNTYFSHDQIYGTLGVAAFIATKKASTSFADPFYKPLTHYIDVSPNEAVTGIKWSF